MKAVGNILITGPPQCGKSTLIERIIQRIERPMVGFLTREIRENGKRVGFSIVTLDGRTGILAHRNIPGPPRVGGYGVNLTDLDETAIPAMRPTRPDHLVILDEIGKMECFSTKFRQRLVQMLDGPYDVLGTISEKTSPFIQNIKRRPDVTLIQVTRENRETLVDLASRFG